MCYSSNYLLLIGVGPLNTSSCSIAIFVESEIYSIEKTRYVATSFLSVLVISFVLLSQSLSAQTVDTYDENGNANPIHQFIDELLPAEFKFDELENTSDGSVVEVGRTSMSLPTPLRVATLDSSLKKHSILVRRPSPLIETVVNEKQATRKSQIARCLRMYYRMPVDTENWRPWTIMHGLLPFGQQSQVTYQGKQYRAVDYLCSNAIGNDTRMLYLAGNDTFGVSVGPGVQGHEGQFLAMLAQSDVALSQPININGKRFTVADLVEYEKQSCKQNTELTFKLIGLSHYLDSDEIWKNTSGQSWNIERLIYEELKQPINGAACGGTHRLMGLSYAINRRTKQDRPVNGQWGRAQKFIAEYQEYAMRYRNPDGSFSTNWFVTVEAEQDPKKRLYTTGHIIEWLSFSLPQKKLNDARLQESVDYLLKLMLNAEALDLEIGPKGHALHALRIYEERCFGEHCDLEDITPADLALVKKALNRQANMKPQFGMPMGTPTQKVSYPGNSGFGTPSRRMFRRR